jgi:small conductance mechanosensitive channel
MGQEAEKSVAVVQSVLDKVITFLVNYSFDVLGAIVILFIGYKGSQWAGKLTQNFLEKKNFDTTLSRLAAGALRGVIFGFAIIVALGKFGITITPIVAAIGALAFGGTLAVQGVLSNLGAGLSLLMFRPFKVGDTITVIGVSGLVEEIKLGCTVLTNEDGERITIPNKHIVGEILTNSFGNHIVESVVGISYSDDPEEAITVIKEALLRFAEVSRNPAPIVGIREFGDSSINIGVRYWVPTRQYFHISYSINLSIYKALKEAKITIPFPQREVKIIS